MFEFLSPNLRLPMAFEDADEPHAMQSGDNPNQAESIDPHFWTDPLTVQAILPKLADTLSRLDPQGSAIYHANAERFARELDSLNAQLQEVLAPVKYRPVFLFHPSLQY